jgi:hypothetical protein
MYFLGTKTLKYIQDKKKGKVEQDWGDDISCSESSSMLRTDSSMLSGDEAEERR